MKIQSGYSFYGQQIGILVFGGVSPRIPGDAGHGGTFSFPVRYEIVAGSFAALAKKEESTRNALLVAAQKLKEQGIRAIAGDCGLMSIYQQELASFGLPVAASSLCQIPMLWQMFGRSGKIGVLTGNSAILKPEHFVASGCGEIPVAVQGMENEPHFSEIVINGGLALDPLAMQRDVLHAARQLLRKEPDVRAVVLECSNLATYARAVALETGLPVFDIVSAVRFLEYGVNPPEYIK